MSLARRVALVDLDWADADAILRAVQDDRVEVRLVLGGSDDEPGVRVADLLGVPHSIEVGDLTRELFDVAVIGDGSPRRAALERLLDSLGTPVRAPATFPDSADPAWAGAPSSSRVDAFADFEDLPSTGAASESWSPFAWDDTSVASSTEAPPALVAPEDAAPPARSLPEHAAASSPGARMVNAEVFGECVTRALAEHGNGAASYVLHRFRLEGSVDRAAALASSLAGLFRGTDIVSRANDRTWVLLCAGASTDPARVDRRLRRAWRRAHPEGLAFPPLRHESVALSTAEDTRPFAAAAHAWLGTR